MPNDDFQTQFAAFAVQLAPPLLQALQKAYEEACSHYASYAGSDENTFGTNVYRFAIHEIGLAAKKDPFVKITTRAQLFRFTAGVYELCCHKVGQSETDDILTHFPKGKGATTMVSGQMSLGFEEVGPDLTKVRQVVVAHMGNPEDGLCAVYLCIGKTADEEHIKEWAYTYCLWKRDTAAVQPTDDAPPKDLTPEETVEEKEPRRKVRRSVS